MHQMRFLFNGARIPGAGLGGIDEVKNYFKTGKRYSGKFLITKYLQAYTSLK